MIKILKTFYQNFSEIRLPLDIFFFSNIIIALPIALITGPAIPDIFISIVALYFLIKTIQKKLWHYYHNPIVYGFILFSIYGIIRSCFSEITIESLTNEGSVFYFRYIFFALGFSYLLDQNQYLSKYLLFTILACILIVSIDGMYQYIFDVNIFGNEKYQDNRLTGLFGDEPIIGRYVSYFSIFGFALIYKNFSISKKTIFLSIIVLVIAEVMVFFSGERSPLFYLVLFSFFILIYLPHYRLYRLIGILFSILFIFSIIQLNPIAKKRMFDQTIDHISETQIPFLPYSKMHEAHYTVALKMFQKSPIFGVGTNTFRFQCEKKIFFYNEIGCTSHPHNYYIQVLAELGIFGFIFIFGFFLCLLFIGLRQLYYLIINRKDSIIPFNNFLFIIVLFIFWWPLIPHMSLYNNWNSIFMMLPLGFVLKISNFKEKKTYGSTN